GSDSSLSKLLVFVGDLRGRPCVEVAVADVFDAQRLQGVEDLRPRGVVRRIGVREVRVHACRVDERLCLGSLLGIHGLSRTGLLKDKRRSSHKRGESKSAQKKTTMKRKR